VRQHRSDGDRGGSTWESVPVRGGGGSMAGVYPLKITQFSVHEKTEALYVQAPFKVDQWQVRVARQVDCLAEAVIGSKRTRGRYRRC
jgi:hypothetical protein